MKDKGNQKKPKLGIRKNCKMEKNYMQIPTASKEHSLPLLALAQNAAPWWGQWRDIYDVIVLSEPWYDLLFFEDLFQGLSTN